MQVIVLIPVSSAVYFWVLQKMIIILNKFTDDKVVTEINKGTIYGT